MAKHGWIVKAVGSTAFTSPPTISLDHDQKIKFFFKFLAEFFFSNLILELPRLYIMDMLYYIFSQPSRFIRTTIMYFHLW